VMLVTLEQSSPHLFFERLDLNTQRRLRHVKTLSRSVKAALFCHHYEIFELA
jgi:hypothetical protein